MKGNPDALEINSSLYESGIDFVKARMGQGTEAGLEAIARISNWAFFHHPGRFADGAVENFALECGRRLGGGRRNQAALFPLGRRRASRTLHLATGLTNVGGNSRVLVKWVQRDRSADHVIVLTDQREAIPPFLQDSITSSGNHCVCLPTSDSVEERAASVRYFSRLCDRVIIYTNPHDTVPVLAFAREDGPPVAMFNHAHFWFTLGSTVSDVIINTLEYFRRISERHRFARATTLIRGPFGLQPLQGNPIDKEAARRALSLPENAIVLMSIGHAHYFRPMVGYDFFRTASTILDRLSDAYLIIVGVEKGNPLVPDYLSVNPRLRLMGKVENPITHYEASDICLESFPFPSLGAVVEAVGYGEAYPVPAYGPGESIFRLQQTPVLTFPYRPPDEASYVDYVTDLARRRKEIRLEAQKMRNRIEEYDAVMEGQFDALNKLIDSLRHCPGEIPVSERIDSSDCRSLAERDQSQIDDKIASLFPLAYSVFHQFAAASKGHQTYMRAVRRIFMQLKSGMLRRAVRVFQQMRIVQG